MRKASKTTRKPKREYRKVTRISSRRATELQREFAVRFLPEYRKMVEQAKAAEMDASTAVCETQSYYERAKRRTEQAQNAYQAQLEIIAATVTGKAKVTP